MDGVDADRIADIHYTKERLRKEAKAENDRIADIAQRKRIIAEDLSAWCSGALIELLIFIRNSNPEAYLKARRELDGIKRGN